MDDYFQPIYFVVTVVTLTVVWFAYDKLRGWRRSMRIAGWSVLIGLCVFAIWIVGSLAFIRLKLPAAGAWLGVEAPWYYFPAVVGVAALQIAFLLFVANHCGGRLIREIRINA